MRRSRSSFLLKAAGIDPERYFVLRNLFRTLGDRQEISLGGTGIGIQAVLPVYFTLSALLSLFLILVRLSIAEPVVRAPWMYLGVFLFVTAFFLYNFLLTEMTNLLVNPVEALALAHQPIDGLTYITAKLVHMFRFVVYGVIALNLIPALALPPVASRARVNAGWLYPVIHLTAGFAVVLMLALALCCVFGLLLRFVPAARIKEISQALQLLPIALVLSMDVAEELGVSFSWVMDTVLPALEDFLPWRAGDGNAAYGAVLILAMLGIGMVFVAVRTLSLDYLSRVSTMVHGGSATKIKLQWRVPGAWAARLSGGQEGRAGFEFVRAMMVRDWEFKRQVIPIIPVLLGVCWMVARNAPTPFSGSFSAAQLIPHAFGLTLLWVTLFLVCGSHPDGMLIFHLVPNSALRPFVRGVHLFMWAAFILVPHFMLLPVVVWLWGAAEGLLFTAYSGATASLYLSFELRLIDGLPFARRRRAVPEAISMPLLLISLLVAGAASALQHVFIFRSYAGVAAATLVLASAAFLAARSSLKYFETAVRHHLATVARSSLLYQEAE